MTRDPTSAPGPGLARLRRQPGAEAVRLDTVRQQQVARMEAEANHVPVASVLPFKVGSRVSDQRVRARARTGRVLHTHVSVLTADYVVLYGHVVHWGSDDVELVEAKHLWVLP